MERAEFCTTLSDFWLLYSCFTVIRYTCTYKYNERNKKQTKKISRLHFFAIYCLHCLLFAQFLAVCLLWLLEVWLRAASHQRSSGSGLAVFIDQPVRGRSHRVMMYYKWDPSKTHSHTNGPINLHAHSTQTTQ